MPLSVIIISSISAWFASGGISVLLVRFSGPVGAVQALAGTLFDADPDVTLSVLSWCLALVLQLMVVSMWRRVFSNMGGAMTSALVGVVFSVGSMALSTGMAVYQLESEILETRAADRARAPILATANGARADALDLVNAAEALSLAAAHKADLEVDQGGTCTESNTPGDGPIQRRSILHAETAQEISGILRAWAHAVEDAADALSLAPPRQTAVNARVEALRALFRDEDLAEARTALLSMATDMDPTVGWTEGGRTYACTDPDYAALISATLAEIEDLMETSISTPRLPELTPAAGFESAWEAVSAWIGGRQTDAVGLAGFWIAVLVEFIQVLLIRGSAAVKALRGELPHRLDAFADGKSPRRSDSRKAREEAIADTLRSRTVLYGRQNWFMNHVPPTPEEDAVIKGLDLPDPPRPFRAIPKEVMMHLPQYDGMRDHMTGAAFDLRKIPSDVNLWLRRVERERS